jgi:hypothetical protein
MLNENIAPNGWVIIHSNPKNVEEGAVTPPSDVTWGVNGGYGTLSLQGLLNQDAKFQSSGPAGVTVVTMACQGKSEQVSVTVLAPVVLPFDHFSPTFE